jgi:hypothetical protein
MGDARQFPLLTDAVEACADKAERTTDFNVDAAGEFILRHLKRRGETPGEILTDLAIAHGHVPHDARAFGQVYRTLARRGLIRCVGYCERTKGHGTAGGRVWASVVA